MTLTYIHHSGFAVETGRCTVIIDCYADPAGVVPRLLATGKPLYVLASHFHPDHFNADVLSWRERRPEPVTYLLSKDILRRRRAPKDAACWIAKGGTFSDGPLTVRAFGSTDSGVSFLIGLDGLQLFHAGDLNNWHWTDESEAAEAARAEAMYLGELKDIAKAVRRVDVAMFPVDARIGTDYMRGARQFVERISTGLFVPMHFTACGYGTALAFAPEAEARGCRFWSIGHDGQELVL